MLVLKVDNDWSALIAEMAFELWVDSSLGKRSAMSLAGLDILRFFAEQSGAEH